MPKPACVSCRRFFRPKINGFRWVEGAPIQNGALPGNQEPEKWRNYKVWNSDLWECQGCGTQILVGAGFNPVAQDYQENFSAEVAACDLRINDC